MSRRLAYSSVLTLPIRRASRWTELRRVQRFTCGPGQMVGLIIRGHRHVVPVFDMSSQGAMIRLPRKVSLGEQVTVAVGRGVLLLASVSWIHGGRAGLIFDEA